MNGISKVFTELVETRSDDTITEIFNKLDKNVNCA